MPVATLHIGNLSLWCTDGKIEAAVQQDTVFTSPLNRSSCSLSLTRLRCSESVERLWGSGSRAAVSDLTCGKVVGKSSCLDRDCRLEDTKEINRNKKSENVGKYSANQDFWHLSVEARIRGRPASEKVSYWLNLRGRRVSQSVRLNLLSEQLCFLCTGLIWYYFK